MRVVNIYGEITHTYNETQSYSESIAHGLEVLAHSKGMADEAQALLERINKQVVLNKKHIVKVVERITEAKAVVEYTGKTYAERSEEITATLYPSKHMLKIESLSIHDLWNVDTTVPSDEGVTYKISRPDASGKFSVMRHDTHTSFEVVADTMTPAQAQGVVPA